MEVRGSRRKRGMRVGRRGLEEEQRGESAEVALLVLYAFLDAEKHGGEPLVQP